MSYFTAVGAAATSATTNNHWSKKTLDGFGRVIKVEAGYGSTTVSQADTEYDSCGCSPMGKMKRVSMPHAPNAAVYWTTYNYDGLGRTVSVVSADGASTKTYAYSGNTVTVTDEAGKWKKYTMDAMGNVVQVEEPKPASDTVHQGNYFTYYAYDVLNHLKQVTMPRRGVTQTRTFNYGNPPGAYLLSATNPENGTVSYTYNANGLVATRTDAKNQQTLYSYDGYNRVTQIRHAPAAGGGDYACSEVDFYYDSNPYVSGYSTYTWGRLAARTYQASNCGQAANTFTEMFSYTPAGQVSKKLLRVWRVISGQLLWADLDSSYGYDSEGKLTSVTYPQALDGSNNVAGGTTYTYGYDSMARLYSMTGPNNMSVISSAAYGPAGELLSMAGAVNETRTYNSRLQLTRLSAPHMTCVSYWTCINDGADYTYTYSANQNNGRITQQTDNSSGEQVTYQYDELNRLISAVTADNPSVPQWGQAFLYDGFGNLTDKSVIKGSAPVWHGIVDPATNRASGYSYDANGNAVSPNFQNGYDVENRPGLVTAWVQNYPGGPTSQYLYNYGYDPDNWQMYQAQSIHDASTGGYNLAGETITFWSPTGQRMGSYGLMATEGGPGYAPTLSFRWNGEWAYFGKRLLAYADRLGSVGRFFPYGEDRTGNSWGGIFATYFPDSVTGWKYAINRYYDSGTGRFMTPDPYRANTGGPRNIADPGSWNRYAYVQGDPVNYMDASGLFMGPPCTNVMPAFTGGGSPDPPGCNGGGGGGGGPESQTVPVEAVVRAGVTAAAGEAAALAMHGKHSVRTAKRALHRPCPARVLVRRYPRLVVRRT